MNNILKWQISVLLSMQAKKHFLPFAVNDIWELLISIHVIVYKQCDFCIQSLHPCTAMWLQLLRINSLSVHTYICVCFIRNYPIFNTELLPFLAQSKNGDKSHSFIEKTLTFWEGLFSEKCSNSHRSSDIYFINDRNRSKGLFSKGLLCTTMTKKFWTKASKWLMRSSHTLWYKVV